MSATQSRFTAGAVPVINEKGMCASVWKVWFVTLQNVGKEVLHRCQGEEFSRLEIR